jgi:hypothetical protein
MSSRTTDRFAVVFGTRRGATLKREPGPLTMLAAGDELRFVAWWWTEGDEEDEYEFEYEVEWVADLRRWLDESSALGHRWLEAWLEGVPGQEDREWTVESWATPGEKRRQRTLQEPELVWLEREWPAKLWWRVDKGNGYPRLRGGLVAPPPR